MQLGLVVPEQRILTTVSNRRSQLVEALQPGCRRSPRTPR